MKIALLISFWLFSLSLAYYIGTQNSASFGKVVSQVKLKETPNPKIKSLTKKTVKKQSPPSKEVTSIKKNKEIDFSLEKVKKFMKQFDLKERIDELKRDCETAAYENPHSCYQIESYFKYVGLHKKNIAAARVKCLEGDLDKCNKLTWDGTEKDKVLVKKIAARKCEQNDPKACQILGRSLQSENFQKQSKEGTKAIEAYQKACELDSNKCMDLAFSLQDRGDPKAKDFFQIACKGGNLMACHSASDYFLRQGDLSMADAMLRLGCESGAGLLGNTCWDYMNFLYANGRKDEAINYFINYCQSPHTSKDAPLCRDFAKASE